MLIASISTHQLTSWILFSNSPDGEVIEKGPAIREKRFKGVINLRCLGGAPYIRHQVSTIRLVIVNVLANNSPSLMVCLDVKKRRGSKVEGGRVI